MSKIGIIGGSGLDDPRLLTDPQEIAAETAFGSPTSPLTLGKIGRVEVVILARHGRRHNFSPTQVNYRANIQALKDQGVTHILATSACGSLRTRIGRGDFIIVDQFIDFTKHRETTFFDSFENAAGHTAMAEPFDAVLRHTLFETAGALGYRVHDGGTMITIEGPRFSTKAESRMFRILGGDVINMSVATEAALANEAAVPYAVVAMSTDYDCWKEDEAPVTWDAILAVFNENASKVKDLLSAVIPKIN